MRRPAPAKEAASREVQPPVPPVGLLCALFIASAALGPQAQALHVTNFRVPPFVPITLPSAPQSLELAKPILLDCDYEHQPDQDQRLAVRWFKNREPEPFYQWLPERQSRYFADWIRPLLNESFVSDPRDPMKRYRSLLLRRLSMNLTGQYTCLVSSLSGQDSRQASLVMYQPPRTFAFESEIYPPPPLAGLHPQIPLRPPAPPRRHDGPQQAPSPTQFRGPGGALVRPPNNGPSAGGTSAPADAGRSATKIVYTHDGRPVRKPARRSPPDQQHQEQQQQHHQEQSPIAGWLLAQRRASPQPPASMIQLHHFTCQATQLTPRPVMMLTVKRDAESIAQYLHEAASVSVRPYQVSLRDYYGHQEPATDAAATVTLYDVTLSATVALNVSLAPEAASPLQPPSQLQLQAPARPALDTPPRLASGSGSAALPFRRGQRMSFECQLEISGTEFEQRRRINVDEEKVFRVAEQELERRRRLHQDAQQQLGLRGRQEEAPRASGARPRLWAPLALAASVMMLLVAPQIRAGSI